MDENCIFCKIINRELPSSIVYEDENVLVFKNIEPQAPIHLLVIPKKHMRNVLEADEETISKLFIVTNKIAKEQGIDKDGFRVLTNCGKNAGQTIDHLHFHILAGTKLEEKMI
ncbi:MAG: histidine triad nucleotide-binding protein [Clostridia bacterium]|nr:histidine triad nucleotide-binding protein [Clostridia bacterium]